VPVGGTDIAVEIGRLYRRGNLIKLLRVMLNYAVDLGMIESNPATGIKRIKSRGDGFHTLTEDEIAKFEALPSGLDRIMEFGKRTLSTR
jgi:hypothetical protein